ncbi:uncharacterized protein LOC141689818 isoform X2 [Apium graveolens]|uniref:uncharacterized protein LOC141689818 isoform X2 n=1 Tax=Apium graveolens TaxID=4045 RepID=UPI003D7B90E3
MAASSSHTNDTHTNDNHTPETSQYNTHTHSAIIDHDNPLHLQSSDSPAMKLVNDVFDGTGFSNWKRSMLIVLSARNKVCFVDGSFPKPASNSPTLKSWSRCNDMVISWILGGLSKSIGRSVIYSSTAHQMWLELEERYGTSNGAQLFGLHKELTEISQGNSGIANYFTKVKMLWDDIDSLGNVPLCTCGCTCGATKKITQFQQDQRVIQFLMGLNDSYNMMRGSILMRSPLPSLGQVYSLLLQEEAQREIHSTGQFLPDSAALNIASNNKPGQQFHQYNKSDNKKSSLHCNSCKKPGHVIDKCYRLHGFPNDFKFNKPKRFAAQVDSNFQYQDNGSSTVATNDNAKNITPAVLTPDICAQFMALLKNASQQSPSSQTDHATSSANFAVLGDEEIDLEDSIGDVEKLVLSLQTPEN